MRLSSTLLESFLELAQTLRFSRAAQRLHLTQSALTRRIQNLESQVQQQLFVRGAGGLELTEAGRVLQRHAAFALAQEQALSAALGRPRGAALCGFFRIAAFSSALRSVVLPALAVLLRAHPQLSCQAIKAEARDLHGLLLDGKVDFCISLSECARMGVENLLLGHERNVLIESNRHRGRADCYIDHDPADGFTEAFFFAQTGRNMPILQRAYFDDIYGLIDAVAEGVGRAVVPLHLIAALDSVRRVEGFQHLDAPVYLQHPAQTSPTRLHTAVRETLTVECARTWRRWTGADCAKTACEGGVQL